MKSQESQDTHILIEEATLTLEKASREKTGGKWLEELTIIVAPYIKEWDIVKCYAWHDWNDRPDKYSNTTGQDAGIDVVAIRRSDGKHIAIQCKARQLDEQGHGGRISKSELDKFIAMSADDFWVERWLVTNGGVDLSRNIESLPGHRDRPIKPVNLHTDLQRERQGNQADPHSPPDTLDKSIQTRQSMQDEAVSSAISILRKHEKSDSGGLPKGQARGKIILPCGTGKTRVSLRIIENLSHFGDVSIVLCPSIALVAQIRREYLQNAVGSIKVLAVCSDETAGYDPKKEGSRDTVKDPTIDNSNVSASVIKGAVTTNVEEISAWVREAKRYRDGIGIIIGTYQSGHRVAEALRNTGTVARVMICDEAHRTAGLRKNRKPDINEKLRNFTICHDNDLFPSTYRVYQTATPKVFGQSKTRRKNAEWIVRSMDDESVFGVEIYRRSYVDAVNNGWLSDYRIIAIGINDSKAYKAANELARNTRSKGRNPLTSDHYIRGLAFALAMGNATRQDDDEERQVDIHSCIAFMNTVDKSRNMKEDLQSGTVKEWIQKYLDENLPGRQASDYKLEHLDATSNVLRREQAKVKLAGATAEEPYGILNVGIFGEGTDTPSLSAVAFLEPRKSPIDVIQAVGRAMRTSPGKEVGYIICPIVIPPYADPEEWLQTSEKEDGWQELGQILMALRAHDERIEDQLAELIMLRIPKPRETVATAVSVASQDTKRIRHYYHVGPPGEAQRAGEQVVENKSSPKDLGLRPLSELAGRSEEKNGGGAKSENLSPDTVTLSHIHTLQTTHEKADGSVETRRDAPVRRSRKSGETLVEIDIRKTREKAARMVNKGEGVRLEHTRKRKKRKAEKREDVPELFRDVMSQSIRAISVNLLTRSGLKGNKVDRDLNILRECVLEAGRHLRDDELQSALNRHFEMDNLAEGKRNDSCNVAALLMMNAAMLHQRIAVGNWLPVSNLSEIKNDVNVVRNLSREWSKIMSHDFIPVLKPALEAIYAAEDTGKTVGLERALRHIAKSAEEIAIVYADMGADHAGPVFNEFMGNQASDGAFFTRPVAASIAARLTLDACGDVDWDDDQVWREHRTVDLACGSGTLLAAMLIDMKRRAREKGADDVKISDLHKLAVEDTIKGMDINPVSLQLAASQLTASTRNIKYRKMGLHWMPYGPQKYPHQDQVAAGTLELLLQNDIVNRQDLGMGDEELRVQNIWKINDAAIERVVDELRNTRIIIMNPPFTNRENMGEKFERSVQKNLRKRTDALEMVLVKADPGLKGFADKNSIRPLFVALAEHTLKSSGGIVTMIIPTVALSATSGLNERKLLADRFDIHTVLTCHQPGNVNLSQNTGLNESIIVMQRYQGEGSKPSTRFICLDKFPTDENGIEEFHRCLLDCAQGSISNGWGEVSYWPSERMARGDWTPAVWRSSELAEASYKYANHPDMSSIKDAGLSVHATGRQLRGSYERAVAGIPGSFPILKSKGADAQKTIRSQPDECWISKKLGQGTDLWSEDVHPITDRILEKAGKLFEYCRTEQQYGSSCCRSIRTDIYRERLDASHWIVGKASISTGCIS